MLDSTEQVRSYGLVFSHEGPARSPRQNRMLAGYLALLAGAVNSSGFMLVGSFTSHVTGSTGRFADDVVRRDYGAAFSAFLLVFLFLVGAFTASTILQTSFFRTKQNAYAVALLIEALLLSAFVLLDEKILSVQGSRLADAKAGILSLAMGMQNSLVTLISAARVRTTHLTGVVTDLGIELARWFRWYRHRVGDRVRVPLIAGAQTPPERPSVVTSGLLATIVGAFMAGSIIGAELALRFRSRAFLLPAFGCVLASGYALGTNKRETA